jgi:ribonuclease HI
MKHYVVWVWRENWVFETWDKCKKSIEWFSWAKYKWYSNKKEAEKAYREWWKKNWGIKSKNFLWKNSHLFKVPDTDNYKYLINNSIIVDWACNYSWKTHWDIEWQGLDMQTWEYIISSPVYKNGTNNVAEFLALVEALKYRDDDRVIFSDSKIAISWCIKKVCNTDCKELWSDLKQLIKDALDFLKDYEVKNVYLWETKAWGENPADYGRK